MTTDLNIDTIRRFEVEFNEEADRNLDALLREFMDVQPYATLDGDSMQRRQGGPEFVALAEMLEDEHGRPRRFGRYTFPRIGQFSRPRFLDAMTLATFDKLLTANKPIGLYTSLRSSRVMRFHYTLHHDRGGGYQLKPTYGKPEFLSRSEMSMQLVGDAITVECVQPN